AEHLLQLERGGDGAAHLVEGRHLLIPTALEELVLMEDGAAVQIEEEGAQNRGHAAASDRENAVGQREIAPHAHCEGGEIASRRPDRERNLPAWTPRTEEGHAGQGDDHREDQGVAARPRGDDVEGDGERDAESGRDRDRDDQASEAGPAGRYDT